MKIFKTCTLWCVDKPTGARWRLIIPARQQKLQLEGTKARAVGDRWARTPATEAACKRCLAGWGWLLASVSLHLGFSRRLLECPFNVAAGFPQSKLTKRPRVKSQCLLLSSGSCAVLFTEFW